MKEKRMFESTDIRFSFLIGLPDEILAAGVIAGVQKNKQQFFETEQQFSIMYLRAERSKIFN